MTRNISCVPLGKRPFQLLTQNQLGHLDILMGLLLNVQLAPIGFTRSIGPHPIDRRKGPDLFATVPGPWWKSMEHQLGSAQLPKCHTVIKTETCGLEWLILVSCRTHQHPLPRQRRQKHPTTQQTTSEVIPPHFRSFRVFRPVAAPPRSTLVPQ